MKKSVLIAVALTCVLMGACKSQNETLIPDDNNEPAPIEEETAITDNSVSDDEADETPAEEDQKVELVIPAKYVGLAQDQEYFDGIREEKNYESVTLNEDGTVTYVMTKKQHEEMMVDIKKEVDDGLNETFSDDEEMVTYVTNFTHSDDYTKFSITFEKDKMSYIDAFMLSWVIYSGCYYNDYNGTPDNIVSMDLINGETGEVFYTAYSDFSMEDVYIYTDFSPLENDTDNNTDDVTE